MDKSAIIICDDSFGLFSEDKALLKLDSKPLLAHVVDAVKGTVDEVIIIVASSMQADTYRKVVPSTVRFAVNSEISKGSLVAALTGFEVAQGKYTLLSASDSPFLSKEVINLLFELSTGKTAVIPRWPDMQCEPLQAIYNTKQALDASKNASVAGEVDIASVEPRLHGVRYVSTMVIQQLDPEFRTFFRVKTPLDLKKAAAMIKPKNSRRS